MFADEQTMEPEFRAVIAGRGYFAEFTDRAAFEAEEERLAIVDDLHDAQAKHRWQERCDARFARKFAELLNGSISRAAGSRPALEERGHGRGQPRAISSHS